MPRAPRTSLHRHRREFGVALVGAAVLLVLMGQRVGAAGTANLQDVVRAPHAYVGRSLRLAGFACTDTLRGLYVCRADLARHIVKIDAERVGSRTPRDIVELLGTACRGGGALAKPECRFEVEFVAVAGSTEGGGSGRGGSSGAVTTLRTGEIVLVRPGPRAGR